MSVLSTESVTDIENLVTTFTTSQLIKDEQDEERETPKRNTATKKHNKGRLIFDEHTQVGNVNLLFFFSSFYTAYSKI